MKILIVRFSSIGDIVLTSSVVRCLKEQLPNAEIHYLTKSAFRSVVEYNTNVDKVHTIDASTKEIIRDLKSEKYDWVIDLHNNLRTTILKFQLRRPSRKFPKLNLKKWLLVKLKKDRMPNLHVVDRYFEAVAHLNVNPDGKKGDFPIPTNEEIDVQEAYSLQSKQYCAIVIGAKFGTKQLPEEKLLELIEKIKEPIVLIGGPEDKNFGEQLHKKSKRSDITNACGMHSILGSASVLKQSRIVVTNDTGMMHIAACYNVPIVSIWGNTVPSLGMYPYRPNDKQSYSIHEVKGLDCRPCSKIGYSKCPKGHFDCMMKQDVDAIVDAIN